MERTQPDDLRWLFVRRDVRNFIRRVYEAAAEDNVFFLASGLTFDALLAAIPLVVLALLVLGQILSVKAGAARVGLGDYIQQFIPTYGTSATDPFSSIGALLENVVRKRGTIGLIGIPLFVWFSTRLFGSLRHTLNEVFDTEESRPILKGKLVDIALVLVTMLLVLIDAALTGGLELLAILMRKFGLGFVAFFGTQLLGYVSIVALFVIVFRYAPTRGIWWRTAIFAAVLCTVAFEIAKEVLAWWFVHFVHPEHLTTDTTVGSALILVGWTYYMTVVFLIGAEIAQVYQLRRRQAVQKALLSD